jgi:hypothetical protein
MVPPAGRAEAAWATAPAAARDYLARGWSVVPIIARAKRPTLAWEVFQRRRARPEELEEWYRRWPDAGVGIVTGTISGLAVLDLDPGHGGTASLERLLSRHGALPRHLEVETGGGGRHLYFRHPGGALANRVGLLPGLDLRGDGGLVVAPPSLHPSGRRYRWRAGREPGALEPDLLPGWIIELLHAGGEIGEDGSPRGHPATYWRTLLRTGVREGERNNTIASLAGHLLWHGLDLEVAAELLLAWNRLRCRPPLSDEEVLRTLESIQRTRTRHGGADTEPTPGRHD